MEPDKGTIPMAATGVNLPAAERKGTSQWALAWRAFRSNTLAVIGACIVAFVLLIAVLAPVLAPDGYTKQNLEQRRAPPSREHPLGADELGRDILDRMIWGARISMTAAVASVGLGAVVGVSIGLVSAYLSGTVDLVAMRMVDIMLALPFFLWAIVILSALGPSLPSVVFAIGAWTIPSYARLARSQALSLRQVPYIDAARALGIRDRTIMARHILPNIMAPIVVQACLSLDAAILAEAALSFLGLGVPLPNPSWGAMLLGARDFMRQAPHMTIFPGLAIVITVLGFNLLADGLRDALDPRLR